MNSPEALRAAVLFGDGNGGGGGGISADDVAMRTIAGDITLTCDTVSENAFRDCAQLTGISGDAVTTIRPGAFRECSALATVVFPNVEVIGRDTQSTNDVYAFMHTIPEVLHFPELTDAHGNYVFGNIGNASHKATIVLPKLSILSASSYDVNMFRGSYLSAVDLGPNVQFLLNYCFYQGALDNLILRYSGGVVFVHDNGAIDAVKSTTKVYVPSALISAYQAHANWSTRGNVFYAIEGSQYETHYADGTPIGG